MTFRHRPLGSGVTSAVRPSRSASIQTAREAARHVRSARNCAATAITPLVGFGGAPKFDHHADAHREICQLVAALGELAERLERGE